MPIAAGGENFTVKLRFFKSAGYTRESVLNMLRGALETDPNDGTKGVFVYEHDSKIMEEYQLEITGIKRDLTPRPVISLDLLERLEGYGDLAQRVSAYLAAEEAKKRAEEEAAAEEAAAEEAARDDE